MDRHDIMRECIAIAHEIAVREWKKFKHGSPTDRFRGDPYTEGMSDGAEMVADAIGARIIMERIDADVQSEVGRVQGQGNPPGETQ